MESGLLESLPPFETEKGFKKISAQIGLYIVPQNWSDLAKGSNLLRNVFLDTFLGAVGGMVVAPDKYYREMLWEYRELIQVANCVRLGAEHFARHQASGLKDVPEFDSADLLKNIQAAHDVGRPFNDFVSVSRGLLVSTRSFHSADIQEAAKIAPEKVMPGLSLIKKDEKQMLSTLNQLVRDVLKQRIPLNPDDLVAIYKDTLMGIESPSVEKTIRAAFLSTYNEG